MDIAKYIDHTLLRADATEAQITQLCFEAVMYGFCSVCVNPSNVKIAAELLKGSGVMVCTVVGFPLGATTVDVKVFETRCCCDDGAQEIDMVINVGALKDERFDVVEDEIKAVVEVAKGRAHVKVILENCLLDKDEIVKACQICKRAGADFIKTSTGLNNSGATTDDVKLMRDTVGSGMGVKAAGGIRNYKVATEMINAGASRLGTSASIAIVKEAERNQEIKKPPKNIDLIL